MPKHDPLSAKGISNRQKSIGLQRLRWYCQMCQKQCRDENGFKCHTMSESHLRQMRVFAENPNSILDEFSHDFEKGYLETLSHLHGTKRVKANTVYQEYIADKHHIHMNSTTWTTLTGFLIYLGHESKAIVDETEKGWFIQYIDRDPKVLARQAQLESKIQYELDEVDRKKHEILNEMKYAYQKLNENSINDNNTDEGDDDDDDNNDKHLLIRNDDNNDHDNKISMKVNLMNNSGKNNNNSNNMLIKKRPLLAISGFNQEDDDDDGNDDDGNDGHDADDSKNKKKKSGNNDDRDDRDNNHENKDSIKKLEIINKNKVTNLTTHNNSHRMNSINMIIKEEEYRKKSYNNNNSSSSSSSSSSNYNINRNSSTSTTVAISKSTNENHHADKKEIVYRKIVDDNTDYHNKNNSDKIQHSYKNIYKSDMNNDHNVNDSNNHNKVNNMKNNITINNNDNNNLQTFHNSNTNDKFWLFKYLTVKYINKNYHNYYKYKGIIIKVYHDDYTADVKFDDDDDKVLRCKQSDLQTVIPKVGQLLMIVNGKYKGSIGELLKIHEEQYNCDIKIIDSKMELFGIEYEDICKYSK